MVVVAMLPGAVALAAAVGGMGRVWRRQCRCQCRCWRPQRGGGGGGGRGGGSGGSGKGGGSGCGCLFVAPILLLFAVTVVILKIQ